MKKTLLILCALLLTAVGASAQTDWEGVYMLSVYENEFLSRGHDYGTAADVDIYGVPLNILSNSDGTVSILYMDSRQYMYGGNWAWTDGGTEFDGTEHADRVPSTYTMVEVTLEDGSTAYQFIGGGDVKDGPLYVYDKADGSDETYRVANNGIKGDNYTYDEQTYWKILTKAERDQMKADRLESDHIAIAAAQGVTIQNEEEFVNYTSSMTETTVSATTFISANATDVANWTTLSPGTDGLEIFQGTGTLTRTFSGLNAEGIYKVTVQGFHRAGWNQVCYEASDYDLSIAYVEAGDYQTNLKPWAVGATLSGDANTDSNYSPNGTSTAGSLCQAGTYDTELYTMADADGSLTVSIVCPDTDTHGWFFLYSCTLTYYGEIEEVADDCDYEEGAEIEIHNFKGTVESGNLFVNGGFNNGVTGWTAGNSYTDQLLASNVTITTTGGYNDGPYVTLSATGAANASTPTQAIAVEPGKSYLLVGYTKYSGDDSDLPNSRYSALFSMNDKGTAELSHWENGTSYSNDLVELQFENTGEWIQTEGIFTVPAADADSTYQYVGMRMNWSTASYDGLQLYELDGEFTFPEDTDYKTNDVVTVDGTVYTVKGANLVENGSFNERTTGWTYGRAHTNPLGASQVTYNTDGGYNDGPYITSKGGGSDADTTPSKEVDVETGNTYLFVGYTNGTAPSDTNKAYNGLFKMSSATSEEEGVDAIVTMNWGDPDEELNGWTKTEAVFTAPTDYVSIRFAWCPGASFDGIQIYEVEATGMEWEMTDAGWGTMILPFAVETVPSGLTMYAGSALTLDTDGTTIMVGTAAETIAANTPYLVSGTEGTYTFTGVATNTEDSYQVGMLVGTLVDLSQDAGLSSDGTEYVLQNHTEAEDGEEAEGLAFYPITEESTGVTLNAYHCYLTTTANVSALHLPGMATGIETVESEQIANDAIYDLSGRRVAKAVNGVYIMNGKKVLVK